MSRIAEWMDLATTAADDEHRTLSASAIDRYERCPLSYKLQS